MAVALEIGSYVTLTADPENAAGVATADTGLVWSADQPTLVTLVPSVDGTEVNVGAVGQLAGTTYPATVNIVVTDANGIVSPADPVVISGGEAVTLNIESGTPQTIPTTGIPVPPGASAS